MHSDSRDGEGGMIPGSDGKPAFTLRRHRPLAIPVLISVPHAGRDYPPALLRRLRHPDEAPHRLEDRLVDMVAESVAQATGAALLIARAPRAMIDLNRSPEDVDWSMISGKAITGGTGGSVRTRLAAGRRAAGGLGLVPRRLPGLGELWNAPLAHGELFERIATVHQPYHARLGQVLETMRDRWGAALLLDLHSMPPLGPKKGSAPAADYVIGDRFGGSCDSRLTCAAFDHFERCGACAAHNRPYAGGYVLDRHGAPGRGISAMQLEICRTTYLDRELRHAGSGLGETVEMVTGLVRRLAGELGGLSGDIAEAAE